MTGVCNSVGRFCLVPRPQYSTGKRLKHREDVKSGVRPPAAVLQFHATLVGLGGSAMEGQGDMLIPGACVLDDYWPSETKVLVSGNSYIAIIARNVQCLSYLQNNIARLKYFTFDYSYGKQKSKH